MKAFRLVSLLEGFSYLLILSVTLGFINREYVFAIGMAHGALFVSYIILSFYVAHKRSWSIFVWLLVFIASLIPFAFIAVELFIEKELKKVSSEHNI
ncbi:DUF3817 domain-containing protein [Colwellia sp. E2M01]|uniref:DUF3817 domain-containing protein n=1 Tax=Colwellia sp. E2M01 TaxID=2841561 RepID=UPI001C096986|nr:DUF3817 domain-containing protein [Colwellia sp. E2M01]